MRAPDSPASADVSRTGNSVLVQLLVDHSVVIHAILVSFAKVQVLNRAARRVTCRAIRNPILRKKKLLEVRGSQHGEMVLLSVRPLRHREINGLVLPVVAVRVLELLDGIKRDCGSISRHNREMIFFVFAAIAA